MTINSLTGMLEASSRLRQLRIQAIEAEQELLDFARQNIKTDLGAYAELYLSGKVTEMLYGRPSGEVRQRELLSALEDAYRAGLSRVPVAHRPGTPAWLHHLAVELEDALARFPRKFEDDEAARLRATCATLLLLATERAAPGTNGG